MLILVVVKEFFYALKQEYTYNIFKNEYCLFGILWGIPIPIVTIGMALYFNGLALNIHNIINEIISHPIQFFFLIHPIIFGIIFGAMGAIRHNKSLKIEEFEKSLISTNKELKKINKELQDIDELKSNFLTMISHELRTPLTIILGYISFLKTGKSGVLTKKQLESLSFSEEEAVRLDHLIEELLILSRIETGQFKINLQSTDIYHVVEKSINFFQSLAESKNITLKNKLSDKLPLILADKDKIFQVIINLIENGIKFNKPGGNVSISSGIASEDDKMKICISDTGIGIEEDQIYKIFDKFYQIDFTGKYKYGGCGLGLAICQSIVELHHGRIWAESKIGAGSKFFIELNRSDAA